MTDRLTHELAQAFHDGNLAKVKKLITTKKDVCKKYHYHVPRRGDGEGTLLHLAAIHGEVDIARFLLDLGASINAKNKNNETALHIASDNNDINMAYFLLKNGANINIIKNKKFLHMAVEQGEIKIIRFFLKVGMDINAKTTLNGQTALHMAVGASSNIEIVNCLLSNRADISAIDNDGETILQKAVRHGNIEIINCLLKNGADINTISENGETILQKAVANDKHDNIEIINCLLENGADINAMDKNGKTALQEAVHYKKHKVIKYLLENEAKHGELALFQAIEGKDVISAQILLNHGINPNAQDSEGNTPLHRAAKIGEANMVKTLLFSGSQSKIKNNIGLIPLNVALDRDFPHIERLLVMHKDISGASAKSGEVEAMYRNLTQSTGAPQSTGKCDNKKDSYESKEDAETKAENIRLKRGKKLRAYKCHKCGKWHLTSSPLRHGHDRYQY